MADLERVFDIPQGYPKGEKHHCLSGSAGDEEQSFYNPYYGADLSADYRDFVPQQEDDEEGVQNLMKPRLTKEQVTVLETQFQSHPKPNSMVKRQLAMQTKLTLPRIANWFQNRRAKAKQQRKAEEFENDQDSESLQEGWRRETNLPHQLILTSPPAAPTQHARDVSFAETGAGLPPLSLATSMPPQAEAGMNDRSWASLQRALQQAQEAREQQDEKSMLPPATPCQIKNIILPSAPQEQTLSAAPGSAFSEWSSVASNMPSSAAQLPTKHDQFDFSFDPWEESISGWEHNPTGSHETMDTQCFPVRREWKESLHHSVQVQQPVQLTQVNATNSQGIAYPSSQRRPTSDELTMIFNSFALASTISSPVNNIPLPPQRSDIDEGVDLAIRRKRPRPATLGSTAIRSKSYGAFSPMSPTLQQNAQLPAPNFVHYVKSTGHNLNTRYAGYRKISSTQRSPSSIGSFVEAEAFNIKSLTAQQTLLERSDESTGKNTPLRSQDEVDNNYAIHDCSPFKDGVSAFSEWINVRSSMPWPAASPLIEHSSLDFGSDPLQEEFSWTYINDDATAEFRSRQLRQLSSVALEKKLGSKTSSESISANLGDIRLGGERSSSSSTDLRAGDSEGELSFVHGTDTEQAISIVEQVLLNATWKNLALSVLREFLNNFSLTRPVASDSPRQNAGSKGHGTASGSRSTSSSTHTSARKRSAESREDSEDADDQEDTKKPKQQYQVAPIDDFSDSLLACPYFKMDPVRYSERNVYEQCYRGCASSLLRDISRLKQHLYRAHRRPEHYCSSCYVTFETQDILDSHNRQRPSCAVSTPQFQEKMDKDQTIAIKRRNRRIDTRAEWYSIFKILFPTADLPASPYADQGSNKAVQDFLFFFQDRAPGILRDLIRCNIDGRVFLDERTSNILDESFEYAVSQLILHLQPSLDSLSSSAPFEQPRTLRDAFSDQSEPGNEAGSTIQSLQPLENSIDPNDFALEVAPDSWLDLNYFD